MKKRLYRWRFFLAVVVVILAGAGIWIFQKKSRTFVPATEVSLKGPYGTLTLQLPEEWNYEIQTEEQDTVYGISFYRGEDKENEVLVKYEKDYPGETCGTGLEEKKIRLAGEKALEESRDGTGVLVGLTKIGNVVGYERTEKGLKPIPGKLFYRGYDLDDIAHALLKEKRFGFEEVAYLLLSGELPDSEQLDAFKELINDNMALDKKTTMNIIDLEGQNIMNILARSVLEMYTFDPNPDDISRDNLMRQSIELISKFPTIIAYAYSIYRHSMHGRSLHIRHPHENLSLAENFLYMIKKEYTPLEARMLDLLLVLQAEHGGGNNSTFTVRVTSSTRTDTYSSIASGSDKYQSHLHSSSLR